MIFSKQNFLFQFFFTSHHGVIDDSFHLDILLIPREYARDVESLHCCSGFLGEMIGHPEQSWEVVLGDVREHTCTLKFQHDLLPRLLQASSESNIEGLENIGAIRPERNQV